MVSFHQMYRRMSFAGRGCVVTGGSKGIGLAVVHRLVELGGTVVTCSRSQHDLDALVRNVDTSGGSSGSLKVCSTAHHLTHAPTSPPTRAPPTQTYHTPSDVARTDDCNLSVYNRGFFWLQGLLQSPLTYHTRCIAWRAGGACRRRAVRGPRGLDGRRDRALFAMWAEHVGPSEQRRHQHPEADRGVHCRGVGPDHLNEPAIGVPLVTAGTPRVRLSSFMRPRPAALHPSTTQALPCLLLFALPSCTRVRASD
jgi:hypothetical protein